MSDRVNLVEGGRDVPTELIAVGATGSDLPARTIATIAFDHATSGIALRPGAFVPDAVARNDVDAALPHVLLWDPFLWDGLAYAEVEGERLFPLLAIPISEAELRFAELHGAGSLTARFEHEQIAVDDWNRASIE